MAGYRFIYLFIEIFNGVVFRNFLTYTIQTIYLIYIFHEKLQNIFDTLRINPVFMPKTDIKV